MNEKLKKSMLEIVKVFVVAGIVAVLQYLGVNAGAIQSLMGLIGG